MSVQDKLATLSTNSRHRVAAATMHESLVLYETHSAAVSHASHDVVTAVRTSRPLPRPDGVNDVTATALGGSLRDRLVLPYRPMARRCYGNTKLCGNSRGAFLGRKCRAALP